MNKKTRQDIANPFKNISLQEKLIKSGSINLENNHTIKDLGNGYSQIIPIDVNKTFS